MAGKADERKKKQRDGANLVTVFDTTTNSQTVPPLSSLAVSQRVIETACLSLAALHVCMHTCVYAYMYVLEYVCMRL